MSRRRTLVMVSFVLLATTPLRTASAQTAAKVPDTLEQRLLACALCHGEKGEGLQKNEYFPRLAVYPPLVNNQSITMRNPVNATRIVLNGGFPPSTEGNPRPYGMPPFYPVLNDEQVAAVVTCIRQSWGNKAPPTWSVEVERSRGVPAD